jgi:amidophosphoribosyltransferase
MNENCGVFGICCHKECFPYLRTGAFNLQHRGQKECGVATCQAGEIFWQSKHGLLKPNFPMKRQEYFKGTMGISHVSLEESQPLHILNSKLGNFAIAFSGCITNRQELQEKYDVLLTAGSSPSTEILARIIIKNRSFPEGIKKIAEEVRGGWAMVILSPTQGIYAARDPYGFRPMVLGKSIDGCAVASESVALDKTEMELVRDVRPGEIIRLERDGFGVIDQLPSPRKAFCAFEWAYTARISSIIEGRAVKGVRENTGAMLAIGDDVDGNIAAGVPMSGIGHALGYAHASGIAYDEVFEYNRYSDRSYTPLDQNQRDEIAGEKLSWIKETIKGKIIMLLDDSIVRGTQMRRLIEKLLKAGAKEVHVRIACPPLIAPCRYNISTRNMGELVAPTHPVDEIRKMLGAKTLRFNTIENFVAAIGLPREDLCLACFTGEYPL